MFCTSTKTVRIFNAKCIFRLCVCADKWPIYCNGVSWHTDKDRLVLTKILGQYKCRARWQINWETSKFFFYKNNMNHHQFVVGNISFTVRCFAFISYRNKYTFFNDVLRQYWNSYEHFRNKTTTVGTTKFLQRNFLI